MFKKFLCLVAIVLLAFTLTGCGSGAKTLKIVNVDSMANTFDLVDVATKQKIAYDKLMLMGQEVIDHFCTSAVTGSVVFAVKEGQIVREGNRVTLGEGLTAYTAYAEMEYELADGVLNITKQKD